MASYVAEALRLEEFMNYWTGQGRRALPVQTLAENCYGLVLDWVASNHDEMLATTSPKNVRYRSSPTYPMCGVASTLSNVRNTCPSGSGSWQKTSRAAPAIEPVCNASIRAVSSTISPRDVLINLAVGFITPISAAPMMPRVRLLRTR